MSTITIGDTTIGTSAATYVIAEAGSNHNGDLQLALELVGVAADAGADAVKFQLFRAEDLYPENCGVVDLPNGEHDFFAVLQDLETPREWLPRLAAAGTEVGIDVLYTPFDIDAVDLLAAQPARAIKIASPELTHHPLLRHIGKVGLPAILSTGMSTLADIEESLGVLRSAGADTIAVLHCVTAYPCPPEHSNLGVIPGMAQAFGLPVGLSDHTLDPIAAPAVAVALGGALVEKHFTLSRDLEGPDHSYAIEPDGLGDMIDVIRSLQGQPLGDRMNAVVERVGAETVSTLIGSSIKSVSPAEAELAACDRRSLHVTRAIAPGDRFDDSNVAVLRGERNLRPGLHPRYWSVLEGAKAIRPIDLGDGIVWEDVIGHD